MQYNSFKLYGLQRTGTNLVRWLMRENYPGVASSERGGPWKHGRIGEESNNDVIIICKKDVWSWLPSIYRYFKGPDTTRCDKFRKKWSFAEFLRSPHYEWGNPIQRYAEMYHHYHAFALANASRCIVINNEDMLGTEGQVAFLRNVEKYGWGWKLRSFHVAARRVNNTCTLHDSIFDNNYYLEKKYMSHYDDKDIAWVEANL